MSAEELKSHLKNNKDGSSNVECSVHSAIETVINKWDGLFSLKEQMTKKEKYVFSASMFSFFSNFFLHSLVGWS